MDGVRHYIEREPILDDAVKEAADIVFRKLSETDVGPVPSLDGQKIRVEFQAPWGKYEESGTVKGERCEISAGPDDNPDVLKAVWMNDSGQAGSPSIRENRKDTQRQ